jgi:hypothetical protein
MKDHIFSLIWAAICAWLFTKALIWADSQFGFAAMPVFAWVVNLLHDWGLSVKKVVFFGFLTLFLVTGIHKLLGLWLGKLIGWAALIVIVIVICVVGWHFLTWIVSTL